MKTIPLIILLMLIILAGCENKALQELESNVSAYNEEVSARNENVKEYNQAVKQIEEQNNQLVLKIEKIRSSIESNGEAFDPKTSEALLSLLSDAVKSQAVVPKQMKEQELLTIGKTDAESIEKLNQSITAGSEALNSLEPISIPAIPDYSEIITSLEQAEKIYLDSVASLKQVTAPTDAFVMDRLKAIDSIEEMDAVTETHDPNGNLLKQGGYIGCIYFSVKGIDKSKFVIKEGEDNVIDIGTKGGGAIEIYANIRDAQKRDSYLSTFDGSILSNGSHYLVGTCLIRISDNLTGSQQRDLTTRITQALIKIKE